MRYRLKYEEPVEKYLDFGDKKYLDFGDKPGNKQLIVTAQEKPQNVIRELLLPILILSGGFCI